MAPYRLRSIPFAVAPLALALAACGSEEQSSGLAGITLQSAVVINEVCANGKKTAGLDEAAAAEPTVNNSKGACELSASCTSYDLPCAHAEAPEACTTNAAATCEALDVPEHGSDDWIELYNLTDREVDLEGYYLSDTSKHPLKSRLSRGSVVPAHGYLVFFANE